MALSTTWALVPTHCPGLGRSEGGAFGRAGGAFRVEVCAGRQGDANRQRLREGGVQR